MELATGCYGSTLQMHCPQDQRIHIMEEFFGLGDNAACQYMNGDCVIFNQRENSLLYRLCEGRDHCTVLLGDRRLCGGAYTNYHQVEYSCIAGTVVGLYNL